MYSTSSKIPVFLSVLLAIISVVASFIGAWVPVTFARTQKAIAWIVPGFRIAGFLIAAVMCLIAVLSISPKADPHPPSRDFTIQMRMSTNFGEDGFYSTSADCTGHNVYIHCSKVEADGPNSITYRLLATDDPTTPSKFDCPPTKEKSATPSAPSQPPSPFHPNRSAPSRPPSPFWNNHPADQAFFHPIDAPETVKHGRHD